MRIARVTVLGSLVLLGFGAAAQEKAEDKAPHAWKCEGDTAETFKVTLTPTSKRDQTTAKGTVQAWIDLADWREVSIVAHMVVIRHRVKLQQAALEPLEKQLLSAPMREAAAKARKAYAERDPNEYRKNQPAEIVSETKADDGSIVVETLQKGTRKQYDMESDSMKDVPTEAKYRYTVVKGDDGKWRISKGEEWQRGGRNAKSSWTATGIWPLVNIYTTDRFPEPEGVKQDTPEAAAQSVFYALRATKDANWRKTEAVETAVFLKEAEPLFANEIVAAAKKEGEQKCGGSTKMRVREIESVKDGDDGRKVVKFKPVYGYEQGQVSVKQIDGKWQVVEAGVWKPSGEEGKPALFKPVADVYDWEIPG